MPGLLTIRDPGAAAGRPFIWGHGLTSSMAGEDESGLFDWSPAAAGGWRVVRYDARGHGASPGPLDPAAYRWPALGQDMLDVLTGAGIDRAVLGGASMGCATALHAALLDPSRVAGLVLVIPPTAWSTRPAQSRTYRIGARLLDVPGGERVVDLAARRAPVPALFAGELAGAHRAMLDGFARIPRRRLAAIFRGAAASDLPAPERLAVLDVPALVLAWDTDPSHPRTTAEALAAALPDATLEVAGTPAEVLDWPARVTAFLAEVG